MNHFNGSRLRSFLRSSRLAASNTLSARASGPTWLAGSSSHRTSARIDFILLPAEMLRSVTWCQPNLRLGFQLQISEAARDYHEPPLPSFVRNRRWPTDVLDALAAGTCAANDFVSGRSKMGLLTRLQSCRRRGILMQSGIPCRLTLRLRLLLRLTCLIRRCFVRRPLWTLRLGVA